MSDDIALTYYRLLLYYKGDISALTLFAQNSTGNVCFPEALPVLSEIIDTELHTSTKVSLHPSLLINAANQVLQLDNDLLRIEPGFTEHIDTPGGVITVYMARFMLLDPPHKLMKDRNCFLRTLPELRGRPPAEMELLRRAYVKVMES